MIGKITKGRSFSGLIKYVLGKEDARLLYSEGILTESNMDINNSFYLQAKMNQRLKIKVGHISLSFSPHDKERFTDELMIGIAQEYLRDMGITNTQYIIVRHQDREHPHCHIVYNRVSNSGRTLPDNGDFVRNLSVCKELTRKYGLYMPKGKENVKTYRLREPLRSKYEMREIIKCGIARCQSWQELKDYLAPGNIEILFKCKGNTKEIKVSALNEVSILLKVPKLIGNSVLIGFPVAWKKTREKNRKASNPKSEKNYQEIPARTQSLLT